MVAISCESHAKSAFTHGIYLVAIIGALLLLLLCHSYNNITSTPIGTELEVVGGVDNKLVNLTVTCDRDAAHLNFSTGDLRVISLRLAQNYGAILVSKTVQFWVDEIALAVIMQ